MLVGQTDWISKREKMSSRSGSKMRATILGTLKISRAIWQTMMFVLSSSVTAASASHSSMPA